MNFPAHSKGMNRNFTALCAALLMCAILIVFYGSMLVAKNNVVLADDRAGKVIYLTFDDGPSDRVTPKILDVLKKENVKATFFIVGKSAETRKRILKREFDEGHTIGVHSYSHRYKDIYASPASLVEDIEKCNKIIKEVTGSYSTLYRFPGGSFGLPDKLINAVTQRGMRYVDWNASTRDAELYGATSAQLFKAAIETPIVADYVVLLAHDTTDKLSTVDALTDIIKYYKSHDYAFATF